MQLNLTLVVSFSQLVVRTDRYTFYRLPVDSSAKSKLVVNVSPVDENGHGDRPSGKRCLAWVGGTGVVPMSLSLSGSSTLYGINDSGCVVFVPQLATATRRRVT